MRERLLSCLMSLVMITTPAGEMAVPHTVAYPELEVVVEEVIEPEIIKEVEDIPEPIIEVEEEPEVIEVEQPVEKVEPEEPAMSEEDIELIALVTMAEAEGESELGKRLVIDTILNRMDSKKWPNTASGVIYQPWQFTSMWNGRVDRCYVRDDIVQLVREELKSRTNSECVFFQMYNYSPYGTDLFKEGCHYFSAV